MYVPKLSCTFTKTTSTIDKLIIKKDASVDFAVKMTTGPDLRGLWSAELTVPTQQAGFITIHATTTGSIFRGIVAWPVKWTA